jgi:hypothetical protein
LRKKQRWVMIAAELDAMCGFWCAAGVVFGVRLAWVWRAAGVEGSGLEKKLP